MQVDLTFLIIEVIVFLVLAVIAIARDGSGNSLSVFTPAASPTGFSGVGLGVVFGILSFIGFDAAATLGEETKNPRRNVPLAVGGALLFLCTHFVLPHLLKQGGGRIINIASQPGYIGDVML